MSESTKWKGLATQKEENFCAQPYHICAECDAREELGCRDAVITIELVDTKENSLLEQNINRTVDAFRATTKKFNRIATSSNKVTNQLKAISDTLKKGRSWKTK